MSKADRESRKLDDLVAEVEAGTGRDRKLDLKIAKTIDPKTWKDVDTEKSRLVNIVPAYTGSLDAALTLYTDLEDRKRIPVDPRAAVREALLARQ